jgi:hypothetical protein
MSPILIIPVDFSSSLLILGSYERWNVQYKTKLGKKQLILQSSKRLKIQT